MNFIYYFYCIDIHFLKCKPKINSSLILIKILNSKRRTTTTTTIRPTTPKTTTTAKLAEEVEDNLVLDFSSGQPEMVENMATQVEVKSEEEIAETPAVKNAFSTFRELIDLVGIDEELEAAGNVTIFSPINKAFDKLDTFFKVKISRIIRKIDKSIIDIIKS